MKKFIIQSILLILVISVAVYFYIFTSRGGLITPQSSLIINGITINVEIADTQAERNKGLGGREALASDEGMLFVFEKQDKYSFWMKGLKFPLDFIWIKGDTVVEISENIQPPQIGQSDQTLPVYSSKENVDKVLEVGVGTIQRLNIKVGDTIILPP